MFESKFSKLSSRLFLITSLSVTADIGIGHLLPLDAKPTTTRISVNKDGQFYTSEGVSLEDLHSRGKILLDLGEKTTSIPHLGSISPDKTKIAFVKDVYNEENAVYTYLSISNIYGGNVTDILKFDTSINSSPVWLDDDTLAFLSSGNNTLKISRDGISTVKIDGTNKYNLDFTFQNFKNVEAFCFDTKTNRIIFAGKQFNIQDATDKYYEIYSINPDGTNPQKITTLDPKLTQFGLTNMICNENGKISFDLAPNGTPEAYSINPNGTNLQPVK